MKYFLVAMLMCMASISLSAQACWGFIDPNDPEGCTYLVYVSYYEETGEVVDCFLLSKSCPPSLGDEDNGGGGSNIVFDLHPLDRPDCEVYKNIHYKSHIPVQNIMLTEGYTQQFSGNNSCDVWIKCTSWMTSQRYDYNAKVVRLENEVCSAPDIQSAYLTVEDHGSNASLRRGNQLISQYLFKVVSRFSINLGIGIFGGSFYLYEDDYYLRNKINHKAYVPLGCYPLNNGTIDQTTKRN